MEIGMVEDKTVVVVTLFERWRLWADGSEVATGLWWWPLKEV